MNLKARAKIVKDYYKRNGISKTLHKIRYRIFNFAKKHKANKKYFQDYQLWIEHNDPTKEELDNQRKTKFAYEPKISIVVPMYNTRELFLNELVNSVLEQTYSNWELCLADGSQTKAEYVDRYVSVSEKIKYKFLNENKGISENTNRAIEMATGEYIALLDHDDVLPVYSLYEIVKSINENRDADFIYTDEDKLYDGKRIDPHFKQDYAPDTLMSYNYICHFSIYRRDLIEKIGMLNSEFDGSQDYDFVLRATENAKKVVHIPKILYHWRMNEDSVALNASAKPYAYEAAKKAIKCHLDRIGEKAEVVDTDIVGIYRVKYQVNGNPKVSIILTNTEKSANIEKCINSIVKKSGYSNYEIIVVSNSEDTNFKYQNSNVSTKIKFLTYTEDYSNKSKVYNYAVKNADGDYVIFVDSNLKITSDSWIETLLGNCQRKDVGIVGAKILYNRSKIFHAGMILDKNKVARNVSLNVNADESGYMVRNNIIQNYNAVTGRLMIISKNDFEGVNGFDENAKNFYPDIDLCLKMRDTGKVVVYNPYVVAEYQKVDIGDDVQEDDTMKAEVKQFVEKWDKYYEGYDSYYNPNFSCNSADMSICTEKVVY